MLDVNATVHTSFQVAWTSLAVSSSTGTDILTNDELPVRAVLDSGTSDILLPPSMASLVNVEFGVENGTVPCTLASRNGTLDFGL